MAVAGFEDESKVEEAVAQLVEALDEDPDRFTAWERDFLESIEVQVEERHLSAKQLARLEELLEKVDA